MSEPGDDLDLKISACAVKLASATRVAVFTGAGMSAESGVGTFRGQGGFWKGLLGPLVLAVFGTPVGWKWMPTVAWSKYLSQFYGPMAAAEPNDGHRALVRLAERLPVKIVTQNVDLLHTEAGSDPKTVFHVHGTIGKYKCNINGHPYEFNEGEDPVVAKRLPLAPPVCKVEGCGQYIRPDCVLFTEGLPENVWFQSENAMKELGPSDVLLIIGTSSTVMPAASLPEIAAAKGAAIFEFNLEETHFKRLANHMLLKGPVGKILPKVIEQFEALRRE